MVRYAKDGTILFGAGLFILGIYMLNSALAWGVYGPEGPGPGFFPLIYGLIMVAFSAVLEIQAIRACRTASPPAPVDASEKAGSMLAIATWLTLMAGVLLMFWLGFVVGFGLVLFILIRTVFERSTLASLVTAASIVLGLYLGFDVLMGLPLPVGKFWGF